MSKDRSYSTAIHVLTVLAYHDPKLVSSEELALSLQTNPGLVRRVLLKLSESKLVVSVKGKGGGNRLAMPANKISLQQVYEAVKEGPLFGSFDKAPFKSCFISCKMGDVLTDVYQDLEEDLVKKMKSVKISSILQKMM